MPFQKGHKKLGGRQKGTINKKLQEAQELAESLGVDPLDILLKFAQGDWEGLGYDSPTTEIRGDGGIVLHVERIPPGLRQKSAKDAIGFIRASLKSSEINLKGAIATGEFKKGDFEKYMRSLAEDDK